MRKHKWIILFIILAFTTTLLTYMTYDTYFELLALQNDEKEAIFHHFYDEITLKLNHVVTFSEGLLGYLTAEESHIGDEEQFKGFLNVAIQEDDSIKSIYVKPVSSKAFSYNTCKDEFDLLKQRNIEGGLLVIPEDTLSLERKVFISDVAISEKGNYTIVSFFPIIFGEDYFGYAAVVIDINTILNGSQLKIDSEIGTYTLRTDDKVYAGKDRLKDVTLSKKIEIANKTWYLEAYFSMILKPNYLKQLLITAISVVITVSLIGVFIGKLLFSNFILSDRVNELVYNDMLTKLPNRRALVKDLDTRILELLPFNLVFIDLDNFKKINDSLGHTQGDVVLQTIAERLLSIEKIQAYRWGGDEFVLIIDSAYDDDIEESLSSVVSMVYRPILLQGDEYQMTCSVGVCNYPNDAKTRDEIIRLADATMYNVKNNGKNQIMYFKPSIEKALDDEFNVTKNLENAIKHRELEVYYQPQYDVSSRKIKSLEALVRWPKEDGSFVSPAIFVPIAERSNLVHHIDEFVVQTVTKQMQDWALRGIDIRVAINISASHFTPHFMEFLKATIKINAVATKNIELEITETVAIENFEMVQSLVKELKSVGITIALDDFGTGYSSLSALSQINISTLKIDRSFVAKVLHDESVAIIIRSIVDITRALGIKTVAEGVETQEQLDKITSIGCDYTQGFFFNKALPHKEIEELLKKDLSES